MTLANRLGTATLRKVTIGLMAMGIALSATTQFSTTRAHAATAFTAGTVTAAGACDLRYNTMTMRGGIVLSNRFPNGAYISAAYAYYTVNNAQQRTSSSPAMLLSPNVCANAGRQQQAYRVAQGIDSRMYDYVDSLQKEGFAALVIDHWTPRGIGVTHNDSARAAGLVAWWFGLCSRLAVAQPGSEPQIS